MNETIVDDYDSFLDGSCDTNKYKRDFRHRKSSWNESEKETD